MKILVRVMIGVLSLALLMIFIYLGVSIKVVKFTVNNKTSTKLVFKDSFLEEPKVELDENYEVEGWYLTNDYEEEWVFGLDKVSSSAKLYAKVLETVEVNIFRDETLISETLFVDYEQYNPRRLGFEFLGLYLESSFENRLDESNKELEEINNVYEKWEIEKREVAIMTIDLEETLLSEIEREDYVKANINVFNTDAKYILTDVLAEFRGRGNSSWTRFDKKGYKIKFDKKQSLFGCAKNKHYALVAEAYDTSLSKNQIAYHLGRDVFSNIEYSSLVTYVDVYINGDYHGLYLLVEHRRVGEGRVDIESNFNELDTGYLIEYDARAADGTVAGIDYFTIKGLRHPFEVKSPKPSDYESKGNMTEQEFRDQIAFIQDYVQRAVDAMLKGKEDDVHELVDVPSIVDMYILQELVKNYDVGWSSQYMFKKPGGKLYFGPPWDFDLSGGSDYSLGLKKSTGLYVGKRFSVHSTNHKNELYIALMKNSWFVDLVKERLIELEDDIRHLIDSVYEELYTYEQSFRLNYERWPLITAAKKDPKDYLKYQEEAQAWYHERLDWLIKWAKK